VPEKDLPVLLPEVEFYEPSGTGESPLAKITEWVNTKCPECGGEGKRETNTMPQWAGSSWYYLRFMDPANDMGLVDKEKEKYWAPVDVYVGGDHAVRHLIYARFWHKFLFDSGVVDSIVGTRRFVERVWRSAGNVKKENVAALDKLLHQTIKKVSEDIEAFKFNTATSQMMIFINALEKEGAIGQEQLEGFLKLLAPFAPHITEELWEKLGHKESIHKEIWPQYDQSKLETGEAILAIQINGKVRASLTISEGQSEEEIKAAALSLSGVKKWLEGKEPNRVIIVPKRIISIVT
jgi:leucyl-tRNA synthetase